PMRCRAVARTAEERDRSDRALRRPRHADDPGSSCRLADGSAQAGRLRGTVVNAVEQELERAVRLRAECDLRPEEEQLPLPYARLGDCHTVLEVLLAPGPPAAQRCRGIEVRDRRDAVARDAERGAVAVYDDRALAHAVCERVV